MYHITIPLCFVFVQQNNVKEKERATPNLIRTPEGTTPQTTTKSKMILEIRGQYPRQLSGFRRFGFPGMLFTAPPEGFLCKVSESPWQGTGEGQTNQQESCQHIGDPSRMI